MGLQRVFLLECDDPDGCPQQLTVRDHLERTAVARFEANRAGWARSERESRWYCPRHAGMALTVRERMQGFTDATHDRWCGWHDGGLCGCTMRATTVRPVGLDTYGQGLPRRYRVEKVRDISEDFL